MQIHVKRFITHPLKHIFTCFAVLYPLVLQAEELDTIPQRVPLEELIVTATKTSTARRLLPISVSVWDKQTLQARQMMSIRDISAITPNVYIPDFGTSRSTPIFIRGIGSRSVNMIGFYYDGVPLINGETVDTDYSDLRSIEILRGSQGMLYGRGAMGGIINVTSYTPLDYQATGIQLTGGMYGLWGLRAQSYQQISHSWGASASFNHTAQAGYFENKYDSKRLDGYQTTSIKGKAQYRNRGWDVILFLQHQHKTQAGYPYAPISPDGTLGDINQDAMSGYTRSLTTLGLSISKYWQNGLRLKSGTSYQYLSDRVLMDQDFSPMPVITADLSTRKSSITKELSLSQTLGRYSWLVGLYGFYIYADRAVDTEVNMPPTRRSRVGTTYLEPNAGIALYHQSMYRIGDRLTAEVGIRYDHEWCKQDYTSIARNLLTLAPPQVVKYPYRTTYRELTPKLALTYRIGKEQRLYASLLRGYQSGGFNLQFDRKEEQVYKPEYSWNYEVGAHLSFWGGRLQADLSSFYIDWRDQQVQQAVVSGLGSKITNAGRSRSYGLEFSCVCQVSEGLRLVTGYGYTNAVFLYYNEYDSALRRDTPRGGNYLPMVPRQTISASVDYAISLSPKSKLRLGLQYKGVGEIYWDTANKHKQAYYQVLDTQLSLQWGTTSLDVWVRNLAGEKYKTYQFSLLGRDLAQQSAPRQVGATIRVNM